MNAQLNINKPGDDLCKLHTCIHFLRHETALSNVKNANSVYSEHTPNTTGYSVQRFKTSTVINTNFTIVTFHAVFQTYFNQ